MTNFVSCDTGFWAFGIGVKQASFGLAWEPRYRALYVVVTWRSHMAGAYV